MDAMELLSRACDAMSVRRVFGEPYEKDGTTVVPVARVWGGGGGGAEGPDRGGSGAGFGLRAAPAGVYVLAAGRVRWVPAVDVNRIVLGCQVVAVVVLLILRRPSRRA